jgi:alpha-beta hydrolase superfamily lysophospholipase
MRPLSFRRWHRPAALAAGLALLLGLQIGCATLDERQRGWIFQPSDRVWYGGAAAAEGLDDAWIDYRSHVAESRGAAVRLHGLWLPQDDARAPVLLYLHGARFDVRTSATRMRRMHDLGFSVLAIDYRGFGRSSAGLPSQDLAAEDAHAAWDWLAQKRPQARRFIFGHSLGGAIAVQLAADVSDEAGLIVEGGFTSIPDVVSTFRWGWLPVGPLITQRFDAGSRVADIGSPLLVVHGSDDTLIQPALGRALFERAREPKRFLLVEGGSHHNTNDLGQPQYREAVAELFGIGRSRPR